MPLPKRVAGALERVNRATPRPRARRAVILAPKDRCADKLSKATLAALAAGYTVAAVVDTAWGAVEYVRTGMAELVIAFESEDLPMFAVVTGHRVLTQRVLRPPEGERPAESTARRTGLVARPERRDRCA